jgi:hypothetical protein
VSDYDPLRDYLQKQTRLEFVLSIEELEDLLGFALPRAAQRASWWETARSPQVEAPQRVACMDGGYSATRLPDGSGVKFKRMKRA